VIDVVIRCEQVLHRSFIGHVERYPARGATELLEGAGQSLLVASDDGDTGTRSLGHRRRGETDARRTTNYDHFGILE
jgi:hypothetical protein